MSDSSELSQLSTKIVSEWDVKFVCITFDHKAKVCPVILFVEISRIKHVRKSRMLHKIFLFNKT